MRILLIAVNAKYIHSNLALLSLKAYAKKYQDSIEIVEYTINNYIDYMLGDIYKKKPEFIGFSCYIWNIAMVQELAKEIHKVLPNTKIWFGGPEVSYDAKERLEKERYIEGIMVGEGEKTFLALMNYYIEGKKTLKEIDGIVYREKDEKTVISTKPRALMDLSEVLFPYENMDDFKNKIIYYETSRGCPFSCSYCLSSIDKSVRLRNIELVKKELKFFLDYKIPQVKFIDRTFNCNREHALSIWKYLYENDNGVTNFHFEIAADLLKKEELDLIRNFREGFIQLEIGVQSTNQKTINAIHRKMDLDKLSYAVNKVGEGRNIHQHLDLIGGLPYEDYQSFRKSFNDVYALKPDQLQLGFLKVLKGSTMYLESNKFNIVYKDTPPYEVLYTQWLNYEELLELKKVEEMVEVYYNSGQFSNTVIYLLHFHETPFDMYKALGDYYEKKNFHNISHSRIKRYDILLSYFKEKINQDVEVLSEIMVYDLYLREKLKSRPSFAKEDRGLKEKYKKLDNKKLSKLSHLEHFNFDIRKAVETGEVVEKSNYVIFNYENTHPLNYESRSIHLDYL
jgi:radical SAM superfamily enzyme YgiQ (UPF0313 family)